LQGGGNADIKCYWKPARPARKENVSGALQGAGQMGLLVRVEAGSTAEVKKGLL
jgi:hypothetical protein